MTPLPWSLLIVAGLALVLGRPWVDAARPPLLVAMAAGVLLSPVLEELASPGIQGGLHAAGALAGGWVALAAGVGMSATGAGDRGSAGLPRMAAPAAAAGLLVIGVAGIGWWPAALLAAAAALAVDPDAARVALVRDPRPAAGLRLLPGRAARCVVAALLLSAIPGAWFLSQGDPGGATPAGAAWRLVLCAVIGAGAGAIATGLLRLTQGREPMLCVLLALPLGVAGLTALPGAPAAAAMAAASLVMARDAARRDLLTTAVLDLERPMTLAAVLLAGLAVGRAPGVTGSPLFWGAALAIGAAAPLAARVSGSWPVASIPPLPAAGAAAVLALEAAAWPHAGAVPLAAGILAGMGAGEILWLATSRRRRPEAAHA